MSRLAPGDGDLPTKLVFLGVDPGSPESRLLGAQLGGEIRHFQNSARQQRGDLPTHHQVKAMPNGRGRMTYSYNQGIETLRVHLEPSYQKELLEKSEEERPGRADPTLAIDILFTNELWTAYDIYTKISETVTPGGNYPAQPETWDVQVFNTIGPALAPWRNDSFVSNYKEGIVRVDFYSQKAPVVSKSDLYEPKLSTKFNFNGPIEFYHVYAWCTYDLVGWWGKDSESRVVLLEAGDRQPGTPGGTYPPVVNRVYGHEERDYFDVLLPAGASVTPTGPNDEPYEAIALGRTGRRDDARLVPCSELQVSKACARRFTVQPGSVSGGGEGGSGESESYPPLADAPPFWAGQGFLARPVKKQVVGVPVEKTRIDIYIGSSNNSQRNQFPATAHDFSWVKEQLTGQLKVQVREFADAAPVGVRVDLETDMAKRTYVSPIPNQTPTRQLTSTAGPSTPPHPGTWHFAAGANWTDGGNEPAEPDRKDGSGKDMMGKLLDQKVFDSPWAQKLDPVPNVLLHEPTWPGEVAGMLYLCTIEWTPPEEVWLTGVAKIL